MKLLAILVAAALLFAGCIFGEQKAGAQQSAAQPVGGGAAANVQEQNAGAQGQEASGAQGEEALSEEEMAVYLDFNEEAFADALAKKKVVYLEFYSPEDIGSVLFEQQIYDAFSQMAQVRKYANVAGFRAVLEEREGLARQYGVGAANTHVIIGRDGTVLMKETGNWSSQKLMESIGQAS